MSKQQEKLGWYKTGSLAELSKTCIKLKETGDLKGYAQCVALYTQLDREEYNAFKEEERRRSKTPSSVSYD